MIIHNKDKDKALRLIISINIVTMTHLILRLLSEQQKN
jgi:hypothetical protein